MSFNIGYIPRFLLKGVEGGFPNSLKPCSTFFSFAPPVPFVAHPSLRDLNRGESMLLCADGSQHAKLKGVL